LRGASQDDCALYVMINAYWEPLTFAIQSGPAHAWHRVIDTSRRSPDDFCAPGAELPVRSPSYVVPPRSVVVLVDREGVE
jgi:glycogen operon protein